MSMLAEFFKESHRSMTVFYPVHYLVAAFPNLGKAQDIRRNLVTTEGFAHDSVLAAPASELRELEHEESGVGAVLMERFSRAFSCEQISTDHLLDAAQEDGGLVIVYCPTDNLKLKAWHVIAKERPKAAHYYASMGVEDLAGGLDTN